MDGDTKTCPRCAETVRAKAQVCRYCSYDFTTGAAGANAGSSTAKVAQSKNGCLKVAAYSALVFVGVIIALAMLAPKGPNSSLADIGTDGSSASAGNSYSMKGITAVEYAGLYDGMSYSEAVDVIGEPGEEISRTDMAGYVTVAYSWKNYDGSNAMLMFQNNKLVSKSQFGL